MSHYSPQEAPATSYPPTITGQGKGEAYPYVTAPQPLGYPSKDGAAEYPQQNVNHQTTTRGDGFWKGCCAALCCCCVLDWCF